MMIPNEVVYILSRVLNYYNEVQFWLSRIVVRFQRGKVLDYLGVIISSPSQILNVNFSETYDSPDNSLWGNESP